VSGAGQYSCFGDVAIFEALRTPWVDLGGALAQVSPIDLGIKVGREVPGPRRYRSIFGR